VRALGNLLNGLLDLSRLSAGFYVPERQSVDLDRLVGAVCAEYERAAAQKGLSFKRELVSIRLLGDPVALGRITRNLIDNAVKYTDRGAVTVSIGAIEGPRAVLRVVDTGRGIPAAELGRIFEEFYQLDNPGRDRNKGVGLGLAIVQRLCELIGAAVEVESRVDAGTCFTVSLPIVAPEARILEPPAMAALEASPPGQRIYVVDDETDIQNSMRTLLQLWGIGVATAGSSGAADRLFVEQGPPNLLIVDLRLGGEEHGAELACRLREAHGDFPILIITGETSSDALRLARERGFTLLQKPIAPEVLRREIFTALGAKATVSA
jgi:CheY-like chemotaxis protein/two-component sensor histidine kinase